ncbi:Zinc finger CCCH domain-containing protein 3 [Linum grandiflorum]
MPDTNTNNTHQTKNNNAGPNQSPDNIEEAIRRLKIHDDQEKGGGGGGGDVNDSGQYPDRPGEPDCVYYLRNGVCGYGVNCRYNHPQYAAQVTKGSQFKEELPERVGEPDCGYYLKTGTCKYGSTCKYHHPKDRNGAGPVSYNLLGLPMRQDEKSCPYYMRTGACKFGGACKFHHPQPASLEAGVPLAGLSTYGSTGSSLIPTAGLPYVGGLPTWSMPRVPYMSAPRLETPQTFAPLYISPSQGIPPPAQGWNTYVGNLSPMSSPSILGSNLVFNSRNHEASPNGQMHLMSAALTSNLPQRPDQPECRHFMNTGTCKYGSDCKYHHPKDRTFHQLPTNAAAPLGLPSRPGQALCSNYITYGICKFGSNCRYDHPFTGYPYSYSLTVPPLSMLDPSSMVTYPPRMLSSEPPLTAPTNKVYYNNNNSARNSKHQYQMNAGTNTKKTTTTTPPSDEATDTTADPSPPPHSSSKASSEASHD